LQELNIFVACQSDDDIPYIMKQAGGEDNTVMGTDYGHHDHAADLEGLQKLASAGGISPQVYEKIVSTNPAKAYAL
jgi:predicted TIM-barrel fold metal-dependent hydrolase